MDQALRKAIWEGFCRVAPYAESQTSNGPGGEIQEGEIMEDDMDNLFKYYSRE